MQRPVFGTVPNSFQGYAYKTVQKRGIFSVSCSTFTMVKTDSLQ